MGSSRLNLNRKPSPSYGKFHYTFKSFTHDVLVCFSYFINNFLYLCYNHALFKSFFTGVKCVNYFYTGNFDFVTKCLEFSISYFIVYTWLKRYSGKFDGYAFHHVLYYRYGMINFREMMSRVLGTLLSSASFGYLYHRLFPPPKNFYNTGLKKTLYTMMESNGVSTLMETLVYSNFNKKMRHTFLKKFLPKLLLLPSLKYEDKYFELVEKYLALLFECFLVELTFSLFLYMLSSLMLKSRTSLKSNLALSTFVRTAFVACGNMFLSKVDGKITLDESKWMFTFFGEKNLVFLVIRLLANLLGALLVPMMIPMPKIMNFYDYKELFPNTEVDTKTYKSEFSYSYYVESDKKLGTVSCSSWPTTRLGNVFSKFESFLLKKMNSKSN